MTEDGKIRTSLDGRVCVVTGATSGIGRATAEGLAARGAHVVLVARNRTKAEAVRDAIHRSTGDGRAEIVLADLSSQAQVRAAAEQIIHRHPAIHVLVNNAAVYTRRREQTEDGIERQLAVNHLAAYLLTRLLLDPLRAGAPSRIVSISSAGHRWARIRWNDLGLREGYNGLRQYANTKLMNVWMVRELARRLPSDQVTANAMHPGVVGTPLLLDGFRPLHALKPLFRTPERGARTAIHLAASPDVADRTGGYYKDEAERPPSDYARDADRALRMWRLSVEMTGLDPDAP